MSEETEQGAASGESSKPRSHHAKRDGEPRGKPGRPPGSKNRASAPRPDGPPPSPEEAEAQAAADELKGMKITPKLALELGEHIAGVEAMFYKVMARGLDDPRWELVPEEIEAQKRLAAMGLLVYGDHIKAWLVPVVLVVGITGPAVARLVLMPAKERSTMGGPVMRDVSAK